MDSAESCRFQQSTARLHPPLCPDTDHIPCRGGLLPRARHCIAGNSNTLEVKVRIIFTMGRIIDVQCTGPLPSANKSLWESDFWYQLQDLLDDSVHDLVLGGTPFVCAH